MLGNAADRSVNVAGVVLLPRNKLLPPMQLLSAVNIVNIQELCRQYLLF